jgi:hypothetical protein
MAFIFFKKKYQQIKDRFKTTNPPFEKQKMSLYIGFGWDPEKSTHWRLPS